MAYADTSRLEARIAALQQPFGSSMASGLAQGIRSLKAGKLGKELEKKQSENDRVKTAEMQRLLDAISGTGSAGAPMRPGVMPQFAHPEVQQLALAQALKKSQMKDEYGFKAGLEQLQAQNTPTEYGMTPVWGQDAQGNWIPYQPSRSGGMRPMQAPEGVKMMPNSGMLGFDPAAIGRREGAEAQAQLDNATVVGQANRQQDLAETAGQRAGQVETKADQFKLIDDVAQTVADNASGWTTGFFGTMMSGIPGTDASDLSANLLTLKAAAGFDKLEEMRRNSPTGGALGNVTERELELLQSTWAALSQTQSPEQFKENLDRFRDQVKKSWDRIETAYQRDYGVPYFGSSTQGGSQGTIRRFDNQGNPL